MKILKLFTPSLRDLSYPTDIFQVLQAKPNIDPKELPQMVEQRPKDEPSPYRVFFLLVPPSVDILYENT